MVSVFLICFNAKSAKAQYFHGPIASALGGAGRGAISSSEAPFLNPASLAHFKDFHLGAFHRQSDLGAAGGQRSWAGVFIDHNPDAIVPSALSYIQSEKTTPNATITETDWQGSFGNFIYGQVAFGISARYFSVRPRGGEEKTNWNGSMGILVNPMDNLGVGVIGYNLFPSELDQTQPATGLGANYVYRELLRVRMDLLYPQTRNPEKKGHVMFGLESVLEESFFFRTGYRVDDVIKKRFFTVGLGWDGPKIAFDYAFEKNLHSAEELTHSFDLRLYF